MMRCLQELPHVIEDLLVVVAHVLGVKSHHGIAITRILVTEGKHGGYGICIDIGQENLLHSCFAGALYYLRPIFVELRTVYMTVGVNQMN
jgi:hypothetical protein